MSALSFKVLNIEKVLINDKLRLVHYRKTNIQGESLFMPGDQTKKTVTTRYLRA